MLHFRQPSIDPRNELPAIANDIADLASKIDRLWGAMTLEQREALETCGLFGSLDFQALAVDAADAVATLEELDAEDAPARSLAREHGTLRTVAGRVA